MGNAYLLKTGFFNPEVTHVTFPTRAFPSDAPKAGDLLMVWDNDHGLVAEAPIIDGDATGATIGPVTNYATPIPCNWLDDADRTKATIRSKIRCDRHDRLWALSDEDLRQLDMTRRFSQGI
jgi:hypothetical protein